MISLGAELKMLRRVNADLSQLVTDKNRDVEAMRARLEANIRMKDLLHEQLIKAEDRINSLEAQVKDMERQLFSQGCYDE